MKKKGQVSEQFNWIFIGIAGGVILLLFLFVIGQLKTSGDAKLGVTVLNSMDAILTGSENTDGTVSLIPINNLFSMSVTCNEDSRLLIENSASSMDVLNRIIFAPTIVGSKQLFIATKELYRPFPLGNAVLLSDEDILFLVYDLGDSIEDTKLLTSLYEQFPDNISKSQIAYFQTSFSQYKHISIISRVPPPEFNTKKETYPGASVLKKKSVVWIEVSLDATSAIVYLKKKSDNKFSEGESVFLPEKQFAIFLAHSPSAEFYKCTMDKLHRKLNIISDIYLERTKILLSDEVKSKARCKTKYNGAHSSISSLSDSKTPYVESLLVGNITKINRELLLASCPVIY